MKKRASSVKQELKIIWDKYRDTLWKIEQAWHDPQLPLDKKSLLTESVMELIKIEKKLKSLESKYIGRAGK